jgi:transcriptional regulator with XRE-family HTH domain
MSIEDAFQAELEQLQRRLADNVRRLRKEKKGLHFSQENLAEAARLHRTEIGSIERGERNPSLATLLILAETFDITLDELANGILAPKERRQSKKAKELQAEGP